MRQVFSSFVRAVFGDAAWDGIKRVFNWLWPILGPAMTALAIGVYQKLQAQPLDFWLLVVAFIVTFILFIAFHPNRPRSKINARALFLGQDDLAIDYAGYGLGFGSFVNVTDEIRKLVKDNRLSIQVETQLFPFRDPYSPYAEPCTGVRVRKVENAECRALR